MASGVTAELATLPLDPPVPFLGSRAPPIPSLSASLCYPLSSRLHRAALAPKSQWCHLLCFPGIQFVGNHFGALVQALGQTEGAPPGTHWKLLDTFSVTSRGQEAPMEPALSGKAGERAWGASPPRGELLRGVAEDNLTHWLTRPAAPALRTPRAKGKFPWRWSTFLAPAPCRRPCTGASRWRRRTAKRAASPCRRDSEAARAREHGSRWTNVTWPRSLELQLR